MRIRRAHKEAMALVIAWAMGYSWRDVHEVLRGALSPIPPPIGLSPSSAWLTGTTVAPWSSATVTTVFLPFDGATVPGDPALLSIAGVTTHG